MTTTPIDYKTLYESTLLENTQLKQRILELSAHADETNLQLEKYKTRFYRICSYEQEIQLFMEEVAAEQKKMKKEKPKTVKNQPTLLPHPAPSLVETFKKCGDIRCIVELLDAFQYTLEEASAFANFYEPYDENGIPEVEHIYVIKQYYPDCVLTPATMQAIMKTFPEYGAELLVPKVKI